MGELKWHRSIWNAATIGITSGFLIKTQPVIIMPPQIDDTTSPPFESTCKIEELDEEVDEATLEFQRLNEEAEKAEAEEQNMRWQKPPADASATEIEDVSEFLRTRDRLSDLSRMSRILRQPRRNA